VGQEDQFSSSICHGSSGQFLSNSFTVLGSESKAGGHSLCCGRIPSSESVSKLIYFKGKEDRFCCIYLESFFAQSLQNSTLSFCK
jgi:hypothetical protein